MHEKIKIKNVGSFLLIMVPFMLTESRITSSNNTNFTIRNVSFPEDDNFSIYNDRSVVVDTEEVAVRHPGGDWGPRRDPLYIVVPVTIAYVVIFVTGLVGNIATCVVIASHRAMHTATNYYLFSLAVSDLLLLVSGLPTEIYYIWYKFPYVFGEAFCVLQGFAAETSANATVLTITAFTIERYVAICHPFLSHTMSKLSRAVRYVVVIWLVAMALAVPQAMSFGVLHDTTPDGRIINADHTVCTVVSLVIPHAFEISTLVFFVAPMSLITVLYVLIGRRLRGAAVTRGGVSGSSVRLKHRGGAGGAGGTIFRSRGTTGAGVGTVVIVTPGGCEAGVGMEKVALDASENEEEGRKNYPRNAQTHASKHVVKMLVAVVVAFFVCWAPFHAQRLLAVHGEMWRNSTPAVVAAFRILTYASGVLYYLSTTVNPLLYHIMSHKFREAFKDTFARFLRCDRRRCGGGGERCYSTLSGRSSQPNSGGGAGTDSQCSRQSSLRHLEADVARLQLDTRRPLVVSFRRRRPTHQPQEPPPAAIQIHARSQEADDVLATIAAEQLLRRKSTSKRENHHRKDNHFSIDLFRKNSTKSSCRKHRSNHVDSSSNEVFTSSEDFMCRSPNGLNLSPNWRITPEYYSDYYRKNDYFTSENYCRSQSTSAKLSPNWRLKSTNYDSYTTTPSPNVESHASTQYLLSQIDKSAQIMGLNNTPGDEIPMKYIFEGTETKLGYAEEKLQDEIHHNFSILESADSPFREIQSLQSKHICPRLHREVSRKNPSSIGDIEVFEEQRLRIEKRQVVMQKYRSERYSKQCDRTNASSITKSCTLPSMDRCYSSDKPLKSLCQNDENDSEKNSELSIDPNSFQKSVRCNMKRNLSEISISCLDINNE